MCFGLSFGPAGLDSGLGRIIRKLLQAQTWGDEMVGMRFMLVTYADNISIAADVDTAVRVASILLEALARGGYDCQRKKVEAIAVDEGGLREHIGLRGGNIPVTTRAAVLRGTLRYRGDQLVFECGRDQRIGEARDTAMTILQCGSMTKKEIFGLAGKLGYDAARLHAVDRALADILRSIFGRIPGRMGLTLGGKP